MNTKKIISRKESAKETKNKIYESAEWLFREFGLENVSVDSIVERAGVAKGSFYVHYKSKDSLIATIISDYIMKVDLNYRAFLEAFPEDKKVSEILIALVERIIDVITDMIGFEAMRIIYEVQISKTFDTSTVLDYNRDLYKVFDFVISRGVHLGEFKADIPIDTLSRHCIQTIRGFIYEWCIRYPDYDLKKQVLQHFEILLGGFRC